VRDQDTRLAERREFWRGVLLAGGSSALPRWTLEPARGFDEREVTVPDELVSALLRLSRELQVSLSSVFLAAHAKVLAALSGEREVSTGYVVEPGGAPLPCRLTTEPRSWRELLLETHRAEGKVVAHADFPVEDLAHELGVRGPLFETVFDPTAVEAGELSEGIALRVAILIRDAVVIRVRFRTDVLDHACATRIARYHLTALAALAAEPLGEHLRSSLLAGEELQFQLHGLAGPRSDLPDRRVHERFEERVQSHPDAIAAEHGDRQLTYRQLNSRANVLARTLLARGLSREGIVAVVCERSLDWMAAVLGIFKAGGAYLPIEPHFPADRMRTMLARADCRFVLAERGSTGSLDAAVASLSGVQVLLLDAIREEPHLEGDPGIPVAADQLAYVFFTSGSTGEPKGVMCEHAGMLNHLFAKTHDLGITAGQVVAQTAPQCFDISLWQLLSAVLAGGRTLLVEQEAILDVRRFVDRIVGGRANVIQIVPSYLDVLLTYLERHPRALPDLNAVSVTGEALKKELVQRWFARQPAIPLVNAYGLTETSDDTNHEVMLGVPARERIPLGRPIQNVRVYVVDEHLSPVPLGAPGEIVFSGVCVGRGYINDPERTQRAFLADPHREAQRLYRSGDFGRWLPDGRLEFLGRRDGQVKISGFRIELGDVENALLRLPGVSNAAVVVAGRAAPTRRLVAFYSGDRPLDADVLRQRSRDSLPEYMVPSAFHWRRTLPLTANGKVDRNGLTALAEGLDVVGQDDDMPSTATERRLAAAWAEVLGIPALRIGRRDNFFDLGGTSLSAVKLAIALDRALSIKDLTTHTTLAVQAARIDAAAAPRAAAGGH